MTRHPVDHAGEQTVVRVFAKHAPTAPVGIVRVVAIAPPTSAIPRYVFAAPQAQPAQRLDIVPLALRLNRVETRQEADPKLVQRARTLLQRAQRSLNAGDLVAASESAEEAGIAVAAAEEVA